MLEQSFEKYIELKGLSPRLIGRLRLTPKKRLYDVEIDIILSESRKIFKHIGILYNIEDEQEALSLGLFELKKKLRESSVD